MDRSDQKHLLLGRRPSFWPVCPRFPAGEGVLAPAHFCRKRGPAIAIVKRTTHRSMLGLLAVTGERVASLNLGGVSAEDPGRGFRGSLSSLAVLFCFDLLLEKVDIETVLATSAAEWPPSEEPYEGV